MRLQQLLAFIVPQLFSILILLKLLDICTCYLLYPWLVSETAYMELTLLFFLMVAVVSFLLWCGWDGVELGVGG